MSKKTFELEQDNLSHIDENVSQAEVSVKMGKSLGNIEEQSEENPGFTATD